MKSLWSRNVRDGLKKSDGRLPKTHTTNSPLLCSDERANVLKNKGVTANAMLSQAALVLEGGK